MSAAIGRHLFGQATVRHDAEQTSPNMGIKPRIMGLTAKSHIQESDLKRKDVKMKGQLLFLALFSSSVVLMGCTPTRTIDKTLKTSNDISVIDYDASRRGAYVRVRASCEEPNLSNITIVAEPAPDVAKAYADYISASLKGVKGVDANIALQFNTQIVDLAKRSQTLQILREALYRISELQANGAIKDDDVGKLYSETLKSVQAIALAELGNSNFDENTKKNLVHSYFSVVSGGNDLGPPKK